MKKIKLTKGMFAIVDDADYEWLSKFKWFAHKGRNTFYAVRHIRLLSGKRVLLSMHRQILGLKYGDPQQCDHYNHNGLANWRDNLRTCSNSQNQHNRSPHKNTSSEYKGVSWYNRRHKWVAQILVNGKKTHLGYFASEVEAAHAYDVEAEEYFGEFAYLNFPEGRQACAS